MTITEHTPHIASLFARGPASTRIGLEQELVAIDVATRSWVPIERLRTAVTCSSFADYVSFEPGGQLELSLPCRDTAPGLGALTTTAVDDVSRRAAAAGIELAPVPVDLRPQQIPLQLHTARYAAMQAHFDSIGPAGRRMMRRTASTQICLDWWPGAAGLEQWQLLNVAGPALAAALARSSGPGSRLSTWLAVDPGRTAFDDRLVSGDNPVAAYAAFARGAVRFTPPDDLAQHLSTLFPPVRPRGRYLEVRFLDVQPTSRVPDVLASLARLTFDDDMRAEAWRRVAAHRGRLGELWQRAASGDAELRAAGCDLLVLALGPRSSSRLVEAVA